MSDEELLKRLEAISDQISDLDKRTTENFAEVRREMATGFENQQEFTRDMETRLLSEFRRWA